MGAFQRFKSWMKRLFSSTDNSIAVFDGTTGDKLRSTGILIDDTDLFTNIKEGDQFQLSQDPSIYREGSWSQTTSGELYTLVGELIMYYQTHNVAIDSNGDFSARDEDPDHCQLLVWTESGKQIYYNTTSDTGAIVWNKKWEFDLLSGVINSGTNTFDFESALADGASSIGLRFNTANTFSTNGARILKVKNNGSDEFYIGVDNGNTGVWSKRAAFGDAASVDQDSLLKLQGTMDVNLSTPQGTGIVDIESTMNMVGAIRQAAAFSGKTTVTGSAALPFISGMLFQVNNNGTGSWGANPGNWGQHPTIIAGRWASEAGSASLGNWGNTFFSGTPNFNASGGSFSSGTFNHFEAGRITASDSSFFNNANGMYIRVQSATTNAYGIYIEPGISGGTDSAGIVLHEDNDGGSILFGAGKDARVYYDGTNFVINPKLVGTGVLSVLGDISILDEDFILGTTTGSKIGTATTQKIGFWNATPIVQPANTVAINDLLVNTGLRASGAYSNFTTTVQPRAGTTAANTAPIKFTSGTLMTTPEAGALEFSGQRLYFTGLGHQHKIMQSDAQLTSDQTVGNTTTETTLHSHSVQANELTVGTIATMYGKGFYSKGAGSHTLTLRVKLGGTTIATFTTPSGAASGQPLDMEMTFTCRTVGATGTIVSQIRTTLDGQTSYFTSTSPATIDTTISNTFSLTAQWNTAAVGSTVTLNQSWLEWR